MVIGKITPALIDPKFLKEIARTKPPNEIIIKSPLVEEIDYICAKMITFIRMYWMYITAFLIVFGYLYYCHIKYKISKKENKEDNIDKFEPGQYIRTDNGVQILQRPIPEAKFDPINKEIRDIYLSDVEPTNCSLKPMYNYSQPINSYSPTMNRYSQPTNSYSHPMNHYSQSNNNYSQSNNEYLSPVFNPAYYDYEDNIHPRS